MITETMPNQLKLDFALWTTKAVKELILREFNICIGSRAIGNYLKNWGFLLKSQRKELMNKALRRFKNG